MREIKFQINSSLHYLPFLRQLLPAMTRSGFKLPKDGIRKCTLALIEAVDNAILHGSKCNTKKLVGIKIATKKKKGVLIEVSDMGRGFDLKNVPEPSLYSTHGRGLFIIKNLMNDVEYKNNILKVWYGK